MAEKRAHSPEPEEQAEPHGSGAIIALKKQKTGNELIVGTVTKEVGFDKHDACMNACMGLPARVCKSCRAPAVCSAC